MNNTLRYTSTDEWVLANHSEEVTIGITDHAQELLGDLVYLELPALGKEVRAGEELGVVESVKAASDFYAPISGVVTAVNQTAIDNPAIVNQDPYQQGWLVKLKPLDAEQINSLLTEESYQQKVAEDH